MNIRLGLCSAYSLLYGVHKPAALLDKAVLYGIKTVSICDINNLYGVHSFLEAAKERDIRPVIGAALTIEKKRNNSVYCFVENRGGFSRLCELLSVQNNEKNNEKNTEKYNLNKNEKIISMLKENSSGLILASTSGEILSKLKGYVKRLYAAVTPDDFGGISAHRELSIPLAFLDTSVFLDRSDYAVHRALRAIGLNKTTGSLDPSDVIADGTHILKTSNALQKFLDSWPQAVRGTTEIAELCQFNSLFNGFIFPAYKQEHSPDRENSIITEHTSGAVQSPDTESPIVTEQKSSAAQLPDMESPIVTEQKSSAAQLPNTESPIVTEQTLSADQLPDTEQQALDANAELRRRTYKGAAARYGELGDGEIERIEYELEIINRMGFASYFLGMDDIVRMSPRTCGRGSGAASIVSYSLGITNVDPIAHNLYFERFLNPSRPDPPDIDVDFAWDERDALIRAVIEKIGNKYCARVANHNFFRPRSALRETAKAYGFSDAAISQLERKIFNLREKEGSIDPLWEEIYRTASRIEGLPRCIGMHCGGLVITEEPVNRYAPVEKSLEGFPLLAWEKEGTEAAGFVKIDLLGNRSLAVIRDTVENINSQIAYNAGDNYGIEERLTRAINDEETIQALARGDSMGVFYIESPAMRQLQKKTGKGDFDHIVIHSSIIRPAANKFIAEYVRRLRGKKWEPLHPRLEYILNETYGILCYQEDVSKTAVALAGFNEADADKLRKVIAKKAGAAKLAVYEKQFFEGCRKNSVSEDTIKNIWEMMLSFDGYSFCKPHSASYAMVSFQSAYLRSHYPAEFMAAVLSNQGGYYRPCAYISECRRMGILLEGPDINLSLWKYYGQSNTVIESKGTVVIGFMAIKGLSSLGANNIIKERQRGGKFLSLDDFSRRIKLSRDDITALCPAGVFDSISVSGWKGGRLPRLMQARFLLSVSANTFNAHNGKNSQDELFKAEQNTRSSFVNNSYPLNEKIRHDETDLWEEYHALGFLRNNHPLILWKEKILPLKRIKARSLADYQGRMVKLIGWPITQKEVWTKDGLTMSFFSFEDETAMYETVIFPQVFERYNKLLFDQRPLLVQGRVMNDQGALTVELDRIETLESRETAHRLTEKMLDSH